ncbi:MAG: universal stress protein [Labilithrix sp.]|nr:universal stress protein [Labilithrix sp.]
MRIETILVPTDFGLAASVALEHAVALAKAFGARIVVLHVEKAVLTPYPIALMPPPETLAEAARAELERFVRDRELPLGSVARLRLGEPAAEILEEVKASNADIVVMGTHGHRGIERFLLGSVAEKIVRTSPVPVLTVRAETSASAGAPERERQAPAPSAR